MHAELHFMRHPRADADPQTSAAEKKIGYKVKARIVEKNEINMKLGTRKGSQGHPTPWFENSAKWCTLNYTSCATRVLTQILRVRQVVKKFPQNKNHENSCNGCSCRGTRGEKV